ncbi:MAG: DNA primase, partial [Synergistaceae bacterium]|nr:DNA primase [Synergistaceae bacterium]
PYTPHAVNTVEADEKAERIIADSGAEVRFGGSRAFYRRSEDFIQLPRMEFFENTEGYYATALHELTHWTGHESRLNRDTSGFGSPAYAREELIAEMGSMFLSAETDIPQTPGHFANHAAYVESWISLLKGDLNTLFKAASEANKAAEFLLRRERERDRESRTPDIEEGAA